MLKQKFLTLLLIVLYCLTGSAAAYAAAGECELNRLAAPVAQSMSMDGMDCAAMDKQPAKTGGATKCWVMCHLLVANVSTINDFSLSAMPVRRVALRHDLPSALASHRVPTPPPDFV